ncbi:hypothetical protein Tpen_1880 (plasmid) [Thermofilum pendens Hrk 5]|uniref:Uncharacterized protein n=1 Tax=Thermofilum pendens (strain DSM 2475 / Hrk 5) TaxID=368408 RepID=A1S1E5_THEPD|nr:hypothetical protein Tpen_1880 [Thermofilum pendens Hrk 5]
MKTTVRVKRSTEYNWSEPSFPMVFCDVTFKNGEEEVWRTVDYIIARWNRLLYVYEESETHYTEEDVAESVRVKIKKVGFFSPSPPFSPWFRGST